MHPHPVEATVTERLSRRQLLALVGPGAMAGLAGCPDGESAGTETGGDSTQTTAPATTSTPDGTDGSPEQTGDAVELGAAVVEDLGLTEVGRESVANAGTVVGYRRERDTSTLVEAFIESTTQGPPAGRAMLASHLGFDEVGLPVADAPRVAAERAGVFVPAGARAGGDVTAGDTLVIVPGTELGEVTVRDESTRVVRGGQGVPSHRWLPDWQWLLDRGWTEMGNWFPSPNWVPHTGWRVRQWVSPSEPAAAPVVVTGDRNGFASGFGESVERGVTLPVEDALLVVPGTTALRTATWSPERVFDAGIAAPMGGATSGVAVLSGADVSVDGLLTGSVGTRAVSMVTTDESGSAQWQAGPTRLDQSHFQPAGGAYQGEFQQGSPEIQTYGGVISGQDGLAAVVAHVAIPAASDSESEDEPALSAIVGVDWSPIGSAASVQNGDFDRAFPRVRLHNSRGFTWVAGGGTIDSREEEPDPEGQALDCGTDLPPQITENTVLQEGCTYTVPEGIGGVEVTDGVTLSIEPGVEIEVAEGTGININSGGTISAKGTEDSPIEIYGSAEERGHWRGLEIRSDDPDNELEHVTVAHAGGGFAAIYMHRVDAAQATIRNCTVRESGSVGIAAEANGKLVDFRNNRIENSQGPPMRIHPAQLASLTGTTTFANNDTSHVLVQPDMAYGGGTITEGGTWPGLDLPYEVTGGIDIQSEVTIAAGATFQFQQGGPIRLFVSEDGQLVADASDGEPVTFQGAAGTPGSWGGLFIRTTRDNLLDNAIVRHGGGGYRDANIGVGVDDPGSLTLRNSTVSKGASAGVLATRDARLVDFRNNTFENMQGPPLDLQPDRVGELSGTSTFRNNEASYVLVGSDYNTVTEDATWPAMGVPYESSTSITIESTIDIEPGATVQFQEGTKRLYVDGGGQLVADASGGDPIMIRGAEQTPGHWAGLFLRTAGNVLRNVTVRDGGGGYREATVGVGMDSAGSVEVQDSTIANSSTVGIRVTGDGTLGEFGGNHFADNEGAPVNVHSDNVTVLTGDSTFEDNTQSQVLVGIDADSSETVEADGTWPAMAVPYEFKTTSEIESSIAVAPGTTLQFWDNRRLFVNESGRLVADGSESDRITFRGAEQTPGYWAGLYIRSTAENLLNNVVVSDGGGGYRGANIGVGIDGPGAVILLNSEITDSAAWGVIVTSDGTLSAENNSFENNASGDIQRNNG